MVSLEPEEFFGQGLYLPERNQSFSNDECFLCGVSLSDDTRSDEHVIPKWVQREYNLWDQRVNLVHGGDIPYRRLTIPCCVECNTRYLSRLENEVARACRQGIDAVGQLGSDRLFLWLSKLAYGLFFRELFLDLDPAHPELGPALDRKILRRLEVHHALLQALRGVLEWADQPGTILLYNTQTSNEADLNFDYIDNLHGPFIAVRLGAIGIVAVLQDWGAIARYQPDHLFVYPARLPALAPIQFREVSAFCLYLAASLPPPPKLFLAAVDGKTRVKPADPTNTTNPFGNFNNELYAEILAHTLGVPIERTLFPGGKWPTFLHDDTGSPTIMPFDAAYK